MPWGESSDTPGPPVPKWLTYEECLKLNVNPLGRSGLRSKLTRYKASLEADWELRRVWLEDDVLVAAGRQP